MELGEKIAPVGIPEVAGDRCPFDHGHPTLENPKNELTGVGTTLGKNMGGGTGVHASEACAKEKDPRERGIRSVTIKVDGEVVELGGKPLPYPLTSAAHHLIPAQESLKGHPILQFMCKEGEAQTFLKGAKPFDKTISGSKVWANVGYNVNGGENGVWLPGNYAVGGGKVGVEVWKDRTSSKRKLSATSAADRWTALDLGSDDWPSDGNDEENERPLAAALVGAKFREFALAGTNYKIDDANPKWAYVRAAMDIIHGQFHDRHEDYSGEVVQYLDKLVDHYTRMYRRAKHPRNPCKMCEKAKRPAGVKAELVAPPTDIVQRLRDASRFFRRYVRPRGASLTARNIYTSKWVSEWMATRP